jgi:hypothetical protein
MKMTQKKREKKEWEQFDHEYEAEIKNNKRKYFKVDPKELMKIRSHKHWPEDGELKANKAKDGKVHI